MKASVTIEIINPRLNIFPTSHFQSWDPHFLLQASRVDSIKNSNTLLTKFSRWLILLYGHNRNVARVLQNCANDLYNVAVIAIPEFSSVGIEVRHKDLSKQTMLGTWEFFILWLAGSQASKIVQVTPICFFQRSVITISSNRMTY